MNVLKKKYQVWSNNGEGYSLEECDTIKECIDIAARHYAGEDFYITKRVDVEIKEVNENDE